jgi:hypothetical protein
MNVEIQMVTANTIYRALELCPNLAEFLVAESVDTDIDEKVLLKLLCDMKNIDAIDFCGSSNSATGAIANLTLNDKFMQKNVSINLSRISFHCCSSIPSSSFEVLLPKLQNIKRLDLTHTQVSTKALFSLPSTASITHLSLARCVHLCSEPLINFLCFHPTVKSSLKWLNIMFEPTKFVPLTGADLQIILQHLTDNCNLEYLNLHGLSVTSKHLKTLAKNSQSLKSLSLGYSKLELIDLQTYLSFFINLKYLELGGNSLAINKWTVQDPKLLFNVNKSVEIFEFSADFIASLWGVNIPGFYKEIGKARRGWIYRQKQQPNKPIIDMFVEPNHMSAQPISGSFFSSLAQSKIKELSSFGISSPRSIPIRKLPPAAYTQYPSVDTYDCWAYASRKINMCEIGIGGHSTVQACKERGIYLYYGYHI